MAVSISISIAQNSQNIANNTSNVTVSVNYSWTYGSWNHYSPSGTLTIDGTPYSFSAKINPNKTTSGSGTLFTKTVNISHNSNGTKSISCSATFNTDISSGTVTASASKTLTTIPRSSSFGTITGTTIGSSMTVNITSHSSAFRHQLDYKLGNSGWYEGGSGVATSATFTININLCSQIPNATSGAMTLRLRTYSGGTQIGDVSKTVTVYVPSSVKPTVSISVSDPTGYSSTYGSYVQGQSKIAVTLTASGSYGSSIKSRNTTADGKTYTTASFTTGVIAGTGTLTISTTVTDSRGRTGTASTTISALAYSYPKISSLSIQRTDASGNANSGGAYLTVTFSGSVTSLSSKNSATYTLQYKKQSASSYTSVKLSNYTGKYSVSGGKYTFVAETASSYNVILTAKDNFKSANKTAVGSSVKKLWSILAKGAGIAIGKIAELSDTLDVDMHIRARKGITIDSEWVDLTLNSNFKVYGTDVNNKPMYKVSGNTVTVKGMVSPTTAYNSSTSQVVIATGIPSAYRPNTQLNYVCQGSGMNRWTCTVATNGSITESRYGTTSATTIPTDAWLTFVVTYQI